MKEWVQKCVPIKFRLGEINLFSVNLVLKVSALDFTQLQELGRNAGEPGDKLALHEYGFLIQSLPITSQLPRISWLSRTIRYVPQQYERYYIELTGTTEDYLAKFSSKSRSTLKRKLRKFEKYSDGEIDWKEYKHPDEIGMFYDLARQISRKTYQENLLDAGLPDTEAFRAKMRDLATHDAVRSYILFHNKQPVAYLYLPASNGVLQYQFLGYDPDYAKWSPGTVLQWLVLQQLFANSSFHLFDFTTGEGPHKKFFSTGSQLCADVYFLKRTLKSSLIIYTRVGLDSISRLTVSVLESIGLKSHIKKLIRTKPAPGRE